MTYRYLTCKPFDYHEALFFVGLKVRFREDVQTTDFSMSRTVFFPSGTPAVVTAVHDYGQGCLLAVSFEDMTFFRPFDRYDFFSMFELFDLSNQ